jgi:uncharacterized protein (TIGR02646 family)
MMRWQRGAAPELIARFGPGLAAEFAAVRARESNAPFRWAQREGENLGDVAREALVAQNHGHCCYCDAYPIGATGRREVDHFRPKSRFPAETYDWANLYLACTACNTAKREQWDEDLLRSDAPAFDFWEFFSIDAATGRILPNPHASAENQRRAARTIDVLDLDSAERRIIRRKAIQNPDPSPLHERAYRFLYPEEAPLAPRTSVTEN